MSSNERQPRDLEKSRPAIFLSDCRIQRRVKGIPRFSPAVTHSPVRLCRILALAHRTTRVSLVKFRRDVTVLDMSLFAFPGFLVLVGNLQLDDSDSRRVCIGYKSPMCRYDVATLDSCL